MDIDEAIKWYELAAEQNEPFALNHLGKLYDDGKKVPTNYEKENRLDRLH